VFVDVSACLETSSEQVMIAALLITQASTSSGLLSLSFILSLTALNLHTGAV
jgi:hypothetical protein